MRLVQFSAITAAVALAVPSGSAPQPSEGRLASVKEFGAKGDSVHLADGNILIGSSVLRSPSAAFRPGDVGKLIYVVGAGNGARGSTLEATITRIIDAHNAALSTAASASVTEAPVAYGTDDTGSVQRALDTLGRSGGGTVYFPSNRGGYMLAPTDLASNQPAAITVNYDNLTLAGGTPLATLYCRGAWSLVRGSVVRGHCLKIGSNVGGGKSNITVQNLLFEGMTNGNTNLDGAPADPKTGDGWDITNKGIYIAENQTHKNIRVSRVSIRHFKGEEIYYGGGGLDNLVIERSSLSDCNGDNVSVSAAHLEILDSILEGASGACVENGTDEHTISHLYERNTCRNSQRNGIAIVGTGNSYGDGTIRIAHNEIGSIAAAGTALDGYHGGIVLVAQVGSSAGPAGVIATGNTLRDNERGVVLGNAARVQITDNVFLADTLGPSVGIDLSSARIRDVLIARNVFSRSAAAAAQGKTWGNPLFWRGGSIFARVVIEDNTINGPASYFYSAGWSSLLLHAPVFRRNVCIDCSRTDKEHGRLKIAEAAATIAPEFGEIEIAPSGPVSLSIDATKSEDGQELQLINRGPGTASFETDTNQMVPGLVTLNSGQSVIFRFSGVQGKWLNVGFVQKL